ncbi:MAG: monovalent cation/H+ antiporter subunit D family protein, partial [Candidatus Dadabacteria bacterium]
MMTHLPVFLVIVPLLAAPLALLLRRSTAVQTLVSLVLLHQLVVAVQLVGRVFESGVISYPIGNWPPPWGIELFVDPLNALIVLLLALIGAIVGPWSLSAAEQEIPGRRQHVFSALLLLMTAGLYGMSVTGDAFNVFVFL